MVKIAEGAYGCVYSPALPCSRKKLARDTPSVGKVFSTMEDASIEFSNMQIVRELDPEGEFSVPLQERCNINSTKADGCGLSIEGRTTPQLTYDYGGASLHDVIRMGGYSLMPMLPGLATVANGLHVLSKAGYVHRDVKESNIVWDGQRARMRLIDFGMMIKKSAVYETDQVDVLGYDYEYYPPEFKIYYHGSVLRDGLGNVSDLNQFIAADLRSMYSYTSELVELNPYGILERVVADLVDNKEPTALSRNLSRLAHKIDVFGFGIILERLINHADQLPRRTRAKLVGIARSCTNPNPMDRMSIQECEKALLALHALHKKK